jgi:hypothetical protein
VTEHFAPIRGGSTTAEQTALTEANAYCADQGPQFLATNMETLPNRNPWGSTSYSVTFRCLLPGDPALARGGAAGAPSAIDLENFVALLQEDATYTMPPLPQWYAGREAIRTFFVPGNTASR